MRAFSVLQKRIALLTSLRLESLDRMAATRQLARIGTERSRNRLCGIRGWP